MPHTSLSGRRPIREAGVTMIEVLVALIIFAFGTLGLAGLQLKAMAFSQSSLFRSQATALTDDILDRMRADRGSATAGSWNTPLTADAASFATTGPISITDLRDWKEQVEALLPSGKASIQVAASVVTITLEWDDSRGAEPAQQFVTQTQI